MHISSHFLRRHNLYTFLSMALLLGGCAVGPDYQKPVVVEQVTFKNAPDGWAWSGATETVSHEWWTDFNDPTLNQLVQELHANNPSIAEAYANLQVAEANLSGSRAQWFPTVKAGASATRSGSGAQSRTTGATTKSTSERFTASGDVSWELDLWGGIARQVESGEASTLAREADWQGALLSMEAKLVATYLQVRYLDQQIQLNQRILDVRQKMLKIIGHQLEQEMVTQAEKENAMSQVYTLEANILSLQRSRAQYEHAIASLIGKIPSQFSLSAQKELPEKLSLKIDIPSSLLEKRPDIVAAEQKVRSANAQIGVKTASYFPSIVFSANASSNAEKIADLFTAPARAWSIGGNLLETIFDGGSRSAQLDAAKASFEAAVAQYKSTVLQAFVEVEDGIVAVNTLTQEEKSSTFAEQAAQRARSNAYNAFTIGQIDYLNYATEEMNALQASNTVLNTRLNLELEKLNLIKAVGRGWKSSKS